MSRLRTSSATKREGEIHNIKYNIYKYIYMYVYIYALYQSMRRQCEVIKTLLFKLLKTQQISAISDKKVSFRLQKKVYNHFDFFFFFSLLFFKYLSL